MVKQKINPIAIGIGIAAAVGIGIYFWQRSKSVEAKVDKNIENAVYEDQVMEVVNQLIAEGKTEEAKAVETSSNREEVKEAIIAGDAETAGQIAITVAKQTVADVPIEDRPESVQAQQLYADIQEQRHYILRGIIEGTVDYEYTEMDLWYMETFGLKYTPGMTQFATEEAHKIVASQQPEQYEKIVTDDKAINTISTTSGTSSSQIKEDVATSKGYSSSSEMTYTEQILAQMAKTGTRTEEGKYIY